MPDYQKLYSKLFLELNDTIDRFQKILLEVEELYLNSEEPLLTLIKHSDPSSAPEKEDSTT